MHERSQGKTEMFVIKHGWSEDDKLTTDDSITSSDTEIEQNDVAFDKNSIRESEWWRLNIYC